LNRLYDITWFGTVYAFINRFKPKQSLYISAHNSTIMSSGDCRSQTTNIYNLPKPHTIAETTVSSSVSRCKYQLSSRTQNHYSTEALKTVKTGMYWYKLII